MARALVDGGLRWDPVEPSRTYEQLLELAGVGPWTAAYIGMRALGDRDAFPATDLGIKKGAAALGLPVSEKDLLLHSERWRPFRAYAAMYLWKVA